MTADLVERDARTTSARPSRTQCRAAARARGPRRPASGSLSAMPRDSIARAMRSVEPTCHDRSRARGTASRARQAPLADASRSSGAPDRSTGFGVSRASDGSPANASSSSGATAARAGVTRAASRPPISRPARRLPRPGRSLGLGERAHPARAPSAGSRPRRAGSSVRSRPREPRRRSARAPRGRRSDAAPPRAARPASARSLTRRSVIRFSQLAYLDLEARAQARRRP